MGIGEVKEETLCRVCKVRGLWNETRCVVIYFRCVCTGNATLSKYAMA